MNSNSESGSALVFIMLISLLLTALGLGLTMTGMTEFSISTELEARERAFMIADGGFNEAKMAFRGADPLTMLQATTAVPGYIHDNEGQYGYRNPLPLVEARNIDFDNPPSATTTRTEEGLLTPADGQPLGDGRYFAKVSLEGMEHETDPLATVIANRQAADPNWSPTLVLRVVGIHESAPGVIGSTTSGRNAVSVVEGVLRRDMSFDLASPLTVVGPRVMARFEGNSFDIDGDQTHTGISVINDDLSGGDGAQAAQDIADALNGQQEDNISGAEGDFGPNGPSIEDGTEELRNSTNPDATNVMDAYFLETFAQRIAAVADVVYTDQTTVLEGGNIVLGTPENPQITYAEGNLELSGGGTGVGILVVRENFLYSGAFDFTGLILVIGTGAMHLSGANKTISGGVIIANILNDENGNHHFGTARLKVEGNSDFIFDSADIRMAVNLLPLKTLLWREVVPEIEP